MPTASWSNGFHSTLSGKCARTLDLKVLRNGLCSKFSPKSETNREKSENIKGDKQLVSTRFQMWVEEQKNRMIRSRFKVPGATPEERASQLICLERSIVSHHIKLSSASCSKGKQNQNIRLHTLIIYQRKKN